MQTAVEWFSNQLGIKNGTMLDQAKEMEKQQIIDAVGAPIVGEQYYNETYGSKGSDEHIVDTNEIVCYTKQDVIDAIIKIHEIYSLHGQYNDTLEAKKLRLKGVSWHIQNILETLKKKHPTSSQTEISDEEMEYNQRLYTKEDVLKAGEIGEINHHDYKHIVKLLDEAREINETYGSKGSDDINPLTSNHVDYQNHSNMSDNFKKFSLYEHKETIATSDTPTSSQTEISDEEIEKEAKQTYREHPNNPKEHTSWTYGKDVNFARKQKAFIKGAKWYREQLKKKK